MKRSPHEEYARKGGFILAELKTKRLRWRGRGKEGFAEGRIWFGEGIGVGFYQV